MTRLTLCTLAAAAALSLVGRSAGSTTHAPEHAPERATVNDNRAPAGTLRDGVLTLRLEAREAEWHPDRDGDPGIVVRAFAESGRAASVPGPLIRVAEGTTIHAFVHNALHDSTLVVHGLSTRGTTVTMTADTLQVRPGDTREVRFVVGSVGTYQYWATTNAGGLGARAALDSQLGGALIVDPRGTAPPRDRVFVVSLWSPTPSAAGIVQPTDLLRFTINGKAWPNTERLAYSAGDSVRFRLVNASSAAHPMHLHGFYFDVGSRGDGTRDTIYDRAGSAHRVVTERLTPGRTYTMTWIPERAGNWLFHCHDNYHVLRNAPLDGTPLPAESMVHPHNHALEMMGGLVMGIEVRPSRRATANLAAARLTRGTTARRLRLVARVDTGGTPAEPAYGFVLQDGAATVPNGGPLLPGPTILLRRGEPVRITVVNELPEATAVHWHGMELGSYYDGVAGFSGRPGHIAPAIAPRDSFEAHFTPPRAGTFIYHPHADEVRQQQAGLAGAIVVVDDPAAFDPTHDLVLLVTVPRRDADRNRVLLNGSLTPAALELRVGERYRVRLVNIHPYRPSMIARLQRDSTPLSWRAVAKDGMDLPGDQATVRPAVQQIGNGETYDFEVVPDAPGDLRFVVTSGAGVQLVSMPVRVR